MSNFYDRLETVICPPTPPVTPVAPVGGHMTLDLYIHDTRKICNAHNVLSLSWQNRRRGQSLVGGGKWKIRGINTRSQAVVRIADRTASQQTV